MSIALFREALEFPCRPNHGTVIGYQKSKNGRILPIFNEDKSEKQIMNHITQIQTQIQRGILDFSNKYLKLASILNPDPKELKPFITKLYDLNLSFPVDNDIKSVEKIVNSEDFGSKNTKNLIFNYSLKDMINIRTFRQKLIDTPWKEASLMKTGIPLILTIFNFIKRIKLWKTINKYSKYE
jgi:hypothetical protein